MAQTTGISLPANSILAGITGTTLWTGGVVSYAYATELGHSNYALANDQGGAGIAGTDNFFDGDANDLELKADIELALFHLSNVAGFTFSLTTDFEASDLKLLARDYLTSGASGLNGRGDFPGNDAHEDAGTGFEAYTYFDTAYSSMTTTPELGGSSNRLHTVIHEIMHSTGFGHPHDTGGGSALLGTTAYVGDNALDNDRYTVMSYERGGLDQNSQSRDYGYAVTPMALDVAAVQHLYGSSSNHSSDTVYALTDPASEARDLDGSDGSISIGRAFYCIWDTGGTDRITYAGDNHVLINLNAATLDQSSDGAAIVEIVQDLTNAALFDQLLPIATASELRDDLTDAEWHAGGFFSRVFYDDGSAVLGGYSIANNTSASAAHKNTGIEEAEGGSDADILVGDGADNRIEGRGGDDLMHGSDGNDTVLAGAGNDVLFGGRGENKLYGADGADTITGGGDDDMAWGGAGNDTISGGNGDDILSGGEGEDALSGQDGNDTATGGDGDDTILGESGEDDLSGENGNDTITGGADNDLLSGGRGDDNLDGGAGNDTLFGDAGDDTLSDSSGRNKLYGQEGHDLLLGGDHNDALWGGIGNDIMQGGKGNDRLRGEGGNDSLRGDSGYDWLHGKMGDDYLSGGGGRDILNGGKGKDDLFGNGGADRMIAGHGKDKLTGGIGKDKFVFNTGNKVRDIIKDFTKGEDKLDLSLFNFKSKAAALSSAFEIGTGNDLVMGFASDGTRIKINGLDLTDLDGGDILI